MVAFRSVEKAKPCQRRGPRAGPFKSGRSRPGMDVRSFLVELQNACVKRSKVREKTRGAIAPLTQVCLEHVLQSSRGGHVDHERLRLRHDLRIGVHEPRWCRHRTAAHLPHKPLAFSALPFPRAPEFGAKSSAPRILWFFPACPICFPRSSSQAVPCVGNDRTTQIWGDGVRAPPMP